MRSSGSTTISWARCLLWVPWTAAVVAGLLAAPAAAETGRRVALVVGNAEYATLPKLKNPANDAAAVAEALAKIGFDVLSMTDATSANLMAVTDRFGEMSRGAETAVFYFAGHGVQVGGTNYLLPTDATVTSAADLANQGLDVGAVIERVQQSAPRSSVVILDACRDNPLPAGVSSGGGELQGAPLTSGLARVPGVSGLLIAYATAPGQVAYDGFGGNSPFAAALAHYLAEPGLEVGLLFRRVRQRVIESTAGAQIPWVEEALLEPLYMHPEGTEIAMSDVERLNGALEIEEPEIRLAALVELAVTPSDPSILPVVTGHIERLRQEQTAATASDRLVQELVDWHRLLTIESRPAARLAAAAFLDLHPQGIFAERAQGFLEGQPADVAAAEVPEAEAEAVWSLVSQLERSDLLERFIALAPSGRSNELARARHRIEAAAGSGATGAGAAPPTLKETAATDPSAAVATLAETLPVYVGTGPATIALPSTPALVQVTAAPRFGTLVAEREDGTLLDIGPEAGGAPSIIRALYYRPNPETRDSVDEFAIGATTSGERGLAIAETPAATPLTLRADIKPHDCDLLAGARFDTQGVVVGNYANEIDAERAITACRDAVTAFPDVPRFAYQLGRALDAAGDHEEAVTHFRGAAAAGHIVALYELGRHYESGDGVAADVAKAVSLFREAADKGDLYAATRMGVIHRDGIGVARDIDQAIEWLVKAARGGHTFAFNHLGYMYLQGDGVGKDFERAFRLFEASANAGDIYGYNNMGLLHERGAHVEADPLQAIAWYEKAARGGQPQAPVNLGLMFLGDRGVPADLKRAAYWFAEAARLGNAWGFSNLGWLYQSGIGVDADPELAAELYARALLIDPDDAGAAAARNFGDLPRLAPVRVIQKRLLTLGFDVGEADGAWGKRTRDAVHAFASGLSLDLDANAPKIRILATLIETADRPQPAAPAAN